MSLWIIIAGILLSLITLAPLSIKWELDKKVTLPAACLIGLFSGATAYVIELFWNLETYQILSFEFFLIIIISSSLLLWRFFRDPERESPKDENVILSPADGEVIYIKNIENGNVPLSEKNGKMFPLNEFIQSDIFSTGGFLIGIAMNFLDVHVNRAPIGGKISLLKHIKGVFLSLKKKEAVVQNERVLIVIENIHFKLGIVQIASRLVRMIIPYIRDGQKIQSGERIGKIRFGSQVDVIVPNLPSLKIMITQGEKVKAGLTIIARFSYN